MPTSEAAPAVDAGWREWIALNHLRGCTLESMVEQMVQSAWAADAATRAVHATTADPVLRAAATLATTRTERRCARLAAEKAKLESVLANQQLIWEAANAYAQVERRSALTREVFFRDHYLAARPVVVTDLCTGWPAMQRWQPERLMQRFAGHEVEIQAGRSSDPDFELNKLALRKRVRFGDFMARVMRGEPSNDCYLTANNCAFSNPDFATLHDDIGAMPPYLDRSLLAGSGHWWIGPAGTSTPLHHDSVMLFHAQVVGRKRWRLISPLQTARVYNHRGVFSAVDLDALDFERFPLMRGVQVLDVVVAPGEALFLPLGWWHQVDALEVSVSLSLSNLDFPNRFDYADPAPPC